MLEDHSLQVSAGKISHVGNKEIKKRKASQDVLRKKGRIVCEFDYPMDSFSQKEWSWEHKNPNMPS